VRAHDEELDRLEMKIDGEAFSYMSLRAPVARELHLVIVGMKAGGDLERVGDEATNIAKRVRKAGSPPPAGPISEDFGRMASLVLSLLRDALESLLQADTDKALAILARDEEIDQLNKRLCKSLTAYMVEKPERVPAALEFLFVSRSLERIGDHATNLAEEVVFLLRGKDIRHIKPKANVSPG
jgi:phosphate transport system protein